ncbi:uncharacterized protein DS421_17g576450 [Arachis hypogaea]|nr:uncharacterized protein DS421_17g576450 [Arachis hypogaea]
MGTQRRVKGQSSGQGKRRGNREENGHDGRVIKKNAANRNYDAIRLPPSSFIGGCIDTTPNNLLSCYFDSALCRLLSFPALAALLWSDDPRSLQRSHSLQCCNFVSQPISFSWSPCEAKFDFSSLAPVPVVALKDASTLAFIQGSGGGLERLWVFYDPPCLLGQTEKSEPRRVWLECYGVPLRAWSRDTFCRIGEQWGEVVECDNLTESCNSFSAGRVLIDTCAFDMINEWLHVTIDVQKLGAGNTGSTVDRGGDRRIVGGDMAAVFMAVENRSEKQDKGRMVNYLNEWNHKNSKIKIGDANRTALNVRQDSRGSFAINEEIDSENTVSNYYEDRYFGNQLYEATSKENGLLANRPNKVAIGLGPLVKDGAGLQTAAAGLRNRVGPEPGSILTRHGVRHLPESAPQASIPRGSGKCDGMTGWEDGYGQPTQEAKEPSDAITLQGERLVSGDRLQVEPGNKCGAGDGSQRHIVGG